MWVFSIKICLHSSLVLNDATMRTFAFSSSIYIPTGKHFYQNLTLNRVETRQYKLLVYRKEGRKKKLRYPLNV